MVTVEALAALDLLIWLGNGEQASKLALCNQSTVSRRAQQAEATFDLQLRRRRGTWHVMGDPLLLRLERELHQLSRLMGRQALRLQAPFWSAETLLNDLPGSWILNPNGREGSPHHCLELLEQRVIDACVATLPERPASDDPRFACFDLFRSPIHLLTSPESALTRIPGLTKEEIGASSHIATFPFNPRPQKLFIRSFYAHHFQATSPRDAGNSHAVYFANSLLLKVLGTNIPLFQLDVAVPSHYVETLVVLNDNREAPAVTELVEVLRRRILELSNSNENLTAIS